MRSLLHLTYLNARSAHYHCLSGMGGNHLCVMSAPEIGHTTPMNSFAPGFIMFQENAVTMQNVHHLPETL